MEAAVQLGDLPSRQGVLVADATLHHGELPACPENFGGGTVEPECLAVACLWHFQFSVAAQLFYQSYWQSAV